MKLYYLHNKSIKKLKSLKEPRDELDSLVDLIENFVEDDGVAHIITFETRLLGIFLKGFQHAIKKFEICSTDLKKVVKNGKYNIAILQQEPFVSLWSCHFRQIFVLFWFYLMFILMIFK